MEKKKWCTDLLEIFSDKNIKIDEPLHLHTLTRLGGLADLFITPDSEDETIYVIKYAKKNNIPLLVLGNGSNMVVRDGGFRGIVLNLKNLNTIKIKDKLVFTQGGADIKEVSKISTANKLSGFEFACGIPGSVGGAVAMNAGAYGEEIKDILIQVTVLTHNGEKLTFSKEELKFEYRHSIIIQNDYIILSAEFELNFEDQSVIESKVTKLTKLRESRQPLELPSAGSIFKRPVNNYAGKLIQECGLQGKGFGGAEVSTKHAGFIVNKNNATSKDYIQTIEMVKSTVLNKFNINLELEVKIVGDD